MPTGRHTIKAAFTHYLHYRTHCMMRNCLFQLQLTERSAVQVITFKINGKCCIYATAPDLA